MTDSYPIFPFYLVIDVSGSMSGALGAINAELPALQSAIKNDPIVGDIARFAVITFAEEAEMQLPLSDLLDVETMPHLTPQGSTNFQEVFEFLGECIPHDMEWFKGNGYKMYRPAIFFITDGNPSFAGWEPALDALTSDQAQYRPNIVTFGFGQVSEANLQRIATFKAYIAETGSNPTDVLRTIAKQLTNSIMASSQQAASGQAILTMPESMPGMRELPVDLV